MCNSYVQYMFISYFEHKSKHNSKHDTSCYFFITCDSRSSSFRVNRGIHSSDSFKHVRSSGSADRDQLGVFGASGANFQQLPADLGTFLHAPGRYVMPSG